MRMASLLDPASIKAVTEAIRSAMEDHRMMDPSTSLDTVPGTACQANFAKADGQCYD
jgi:hypothetical protein